MALVVCEDEALPWSASFAKGLCEVERVRLPPTLGDSVGELVSVAKAQAVGVGELLSASDEVSVAWEDKEAELHAEGADVEDWSRVARELRDPSLEVGLCVVEGLERTE